MPPLQKAKRIRYWYENSSARGVLSITKASFASSPKISKEELLVGVQLNKGTTENRANLGPQRIKEHTLRALDEVTAASR